MIHNRSSISLFNFISLNSIKFKFIKKIILTVILKRRGIKTAICTYFWRNIKITNY